eukprot:114515_1
MSSPKKSLLKNPFQSPKKGPPLVLLSPSKNKRQPPPKKGCLSNEIIRESSPKPKTTSSTSPRSYSKPPPKIIFSGPSGLLKRGTIKRLKNPTPETRISPK